MGMGVLFAVVMFLLGCFVAVMIEGGNDFTILIVYIIFIYGPISCGQRAVLIVQSRDLLSKAGKRERR